MLDSGEIDVLDVRTNAPSTTYMQPFTKGELTGGIVQNEYVNFAGQSAGNFINSMNRHRQGRDKQKANRNAGFTGTQSVLGGGAF